MTIAPAVHWTRAAEPPAPLVVALHWDDFILWRTGRKLTHRNAAGQLVRLPPPPVPGQHEAAIGPTGEGKTNHVVPLLQRRKYAIALDPKGEDETLAKSGFTRVLSLPPRGRLPRQVRRDLEEGRPVRLIVGGEMRTAQQEAELRRLMGEAIDFCKYSGHWTIFADEFEVLTSTQMFNFAPQFNTMLNTARARKISVWTAYQAQAWVSKHAIRQARQATLWTTGDRDMIKAVSQALGRNWRDVAPAVDLLPPFHSLTIRRGANSGPMIITIAPEL